MAPSRSATFDMIRPATSTTVRAESGSARAAPCTRTRHFFEQSRRERKKIEMRFAHLKRILRLGRLRLRGPRGAQDEFVLAGIAQNLRRLATLVALPPPARLRAPCSVGIA